MSNLRSLLASVAVLMAVASAEAQEKKKIDSDEYKNWSKFKVGTTAKMKMTLVAAGQTTETVSTTKLLEVKDGKLVLETETEGKVEGKPVKVPTQKRDVTKTVEVTAKEAEVAKAGKPEGTFEEGTETLKVGGIEYKTKWYKYKMKFEMVGEASGQVWVSDDVPGQIVKLISKADQGESTMELVEFTKK